MFCFYLLETYSFLMIDRKKVALIRGVEEEWGGIEGAETVIRIYCRRKE